jgi:hypothetical protein
MLASAAASERLQVVPDPSDDAEDAESRDRGSGEKSSFTEEPRGRVIETPEYIAFLERALRAAGRRVAAGDPEGLRHLAILRQTIEEAMAMGARGLHAQGYSWAAIAEPLNITREAAWQRWGRDGGTDEA